MRKPIVLGAIAVAAVFAGVWYLAGRDAGLTTAQPSAHPERGGETAAVPAAGVAAPASTAASTAPSDSRLRALLVSPDNGLIEFVKEPGGRVIKEIDRDPSSARYGKPAREYTYSGNQVVGVTTYKHLGDQIQVSRIMVSFKPDGGIEEFRETTNYEPALGSQ